MRNDGGFVIIGLLLIVLFNITVGGLATQYVINTWGSALKHHSVHVSFLLSAILGLFIGEFTVPAAIVTWLVLLFC